ncbi:MAG: pYEATS domain-containing protein [Terrimicrobiaceae bacterium]
MNNPTAKSDQTLARWSSALAGFVALCGLIRVFSYCSMSLDERLGTVTLTYFGAAAALLLLPRIKSFSIGNTKAEFHELETRVESALELAKTVESQSRAMASGGTSNDVQLDAVAILPGSKPDDPWNGQFGGASKTNGRHLFAEVKPIPDDPDWFLVRLVVESTDPSNPLSGDVRFFIHDSFPNNRPVIPAIGGKAELRLRAWGAFTVGALADGGKTRLELDLSTDLSFPALFRSR